MQRREKIAKLKPIRVYASKNCDNMIKSLKETINDSQNFIELVNEEEKKKPIFFPILNKTNINKNGFITQSSNPQKFLLKSLSCNDFFYSNIKQSSRVFKESSLQLKLSTISSNVNSVTSTLS